MYHDSVCFWGLHCEGMIFSCLKPHRAVESPQSRPSICLVCDWLEYCAVVLVIGMLDEVATSTLKLLGVHIWMEIELTETSTFLACCVSQ